MRGAEPIPREQRTDERYINVLTVFGTSMTSLLPVGIGSATTRGFGMTLTTAALKVAFLQLLLGIPAAYIITIVPRTGMRQMIQSRYCFGKYCNARTSLIVILTVGGFAVIASVNGGQCLASVHPGDRSLDGAIAIIMSVSMVIGCLGYEVLHFFTRWGWIPSLFALIILACYMPPKTPRLRIAAYCLFGICVPFYLLKILGAVAGGAVFSIPEWQAAFTKGGVGAVIGTILITRLGAFGRFVLALLGLSVLGTCGRDVYSISANLPALLPVLRKVPRVVQALLSAIVITAIAIPASKSIISCFLVEWFYFRKADPNSFDPTIWDDGNALPSGLAAVATTILAWAFIISTMETEWYTGPIAHKTGDPGFEFAVIISTLAYIPLRSWEIKRRGHI
ncbi:hypothetical protein BCR34DRAFT_628798 [Clohesyomyces aquaticus]|uniref:Permease for cytosine/purines, uracil, thiamine, allantoin-domain-containing protein n=1 Tax=Clohesyomyces aquaticus TaxID=1231657 RepID=A0A1Y1YF03_9PLEO|nr:hypothetical protein BCR34DRAFT_628798 [Clohesyomyces aquaticus]